MVESFKQPMEARSRLQGVAERHYTKALSGLATANSAGLSIDAVLTTCLIFYSLESLRDAPGRALQHARSGINIIRDRPPSSSSSPRAESLTDALFRNFLALQNQVQEMTDPKPSRAYDTIDGFDPVVRSEFATVEDALHHVEIIHNEIYCLLCYCEDLQSSGCDLAALQPTEILPRFQKALFRYEQWCKGVRHLEALIEPRPSDSTYPGYLILKIYEAIGGSMLSSFSTGEAWNTYDPSFVQGLDLIEQFLKHQTQLSTDGSRTFTVSLGVIPLLFTLAFRSNNVAIRDRAFKLLKESKRREGLWDSETVAKWVEPVIARKNQMLLDAVPQCSMHSQVCFVSESTIELKVTYSLPHLRDTRNDGLGVASSKKGLRTHVEVVRIAAA